MRFVPESIRWYHSKGRIDDALSVLRNVSKWNKRTFLEKKTLEPFYKNNKIEEGTYLDLFTKKHCLKTLILFFTWFTGDCVYYGISLAFSDLSGHRHRDFVLISLPEIFANLLAIYAVGRIGRKKTTIIGFAVTAIGLMTLGTLMYNDVHYQSLNIVVGMIGKCFGIIAYCSNQILSVESYPTNIRSQAMGLFYVFSQLGGALAPWIAKGLLRYHVTLPLFVLGVFPIIASILALSLKETKGKDIDQQEADEGITKNNEQSLNKNETHC
ncbi:solute carrier family 22 member 13-like [Clytia hemisphaerica]